ncbi:hypothetical protein Pst134EA_033528 [Puccinia striiformis f. sp. tritici]|uniref:hypothetical protein n=1 Tax=Puccinia striiformis f. sp. tritici TaxID=168172 RepID=UPI002007FC00|nr:hypothetical protein Pst134EA_033528 [Puccinia striiformis f. sp. tritici]KAH9460928.1 hypothetical protein Pst134EA_033528 [Puccinia striiformis f. sp. tritici]
MADLTKFTVRLRACRWKECRRGLCPTQHCYVSGSVLPNLHVSNRIFVMRSKMGATDSFFLLFLQFARDVYLADYAKDVQHGNSPSEQAISGQRLGKSLKSHEIDGMMKVCKVTQHL